MNASALVNGTAMLTAHVTRVASSNHTALMVAQHGAKHAAWEADIQMRLREDAQRKTGSPPPMPSRSSARPRHAHVTMRERQPRNPGMYINPAAVAARATARKLPRVRNVVPKSAPAQVPARVGCMPALPRVDGECAATAWMREYAIFHAAQRCNASAPVLVYSAASDRMRCTYLGDKVIIVSFALRMAARLRRLLYIDWPSPCGIETYLIPPCVDWRMHDATHLACVRAPLQKWNMAPASVSNIKNDSAHGVVVEALMRERLEPARQPGCVRFHGNFRWPSSFTSAEYAQSNGTAADAFHYLFSPTPMLRDSIAEAQRSLFGIPQPPPPSARPPPPPPSAPPPPVLTNTSLVNGTAIISSTSLVNGTAIISSIGNELDEALAEVGLDKKPPSSILTAPPPPLLSPPPPPPPAMQLPPYMGMHVRMGDGAAGTSMPTEKWFVTDRRLTHAEAMHMVGCALRSYPFNVLVSTDNAKLRSALVAHDAGTLGIRPPEMIPWAHEAVFGRYGGGRRGVRAPLERVYSWAGPKHSEERAFGATNDTSFKRIDSFGEFRMRTAFTELGLMAGSTCLVPYVHNGPTP